jgi:hypothetical protein
MAADAVQRQRHEGKTCRYRQILARFTGFPGVSALENPVQAPKGSLGEAVRFPFFSDELSCKGFTGQGANLLCSINWPATCSLPSHDEVVLDRFQNIARIQPECSRSVAAAVSFLLIWTDFGRYSSKLPYTPSDIAAAVQHFIDRQKRTEARNQKMRKLFFWFLVFAFWF